MASPALDARPSYSVGPSAALDAPIYCPAAEVAVYRAVDQAAISYEVIMKPSVGRTVHYHLGAGAKPVNGTLTHPAIVTRVHSDEEGAMVNLQVLFDFGPVEVRGSVSHASKVRHGEQSWDWPPRET